MDQLLDSKSIVFTVIALVPNLLLILWAMARLSRDVRICNAKLSMIENEVRVIDQGLNSVSEQARRATRAIEATAKPQRVETRDDGSLQDGGGSGNT